MGLLKKDGELEDRIYGFGIYTVSDVPLESGYMLWGNALAIRSGLQKKRLIFGLIELVMSMFPDKHFLWIGARTQNPAIYRRYIKYAKTFFPFDEDYGTEGGRKVLDFISNNIPQLADHTADNRIPANGICRGIYGRKFGNYAVDGDDPHLEKYENYLSQHNFDRDAGDGVVVVARRDVGVGYSISDVSSVVLA